MKFHSAVILIVLCFVIESTNSLESCNSCGSECARACGTRHFRTCCFNYVRKRSDSFPPLPLNALNYGLTYYRGTPAMKFTESSNEGKRIKSFPKRSEFAKNNAEMDTLYNDKFASLTPHQQILSEDPRQKPDFDDIGI